MIQLPRLLDKQMQEVARLQPVSLSLDLNMAPLSTATMTLPEGQPEMQTGAFVELFTPYGSAGIFRVQQANQQFGGIMTLNLEHGIVTLADGIIPGTLEEEKTTSARAALAEIIGYQDVWRLGTVEVPEDTMLSWSYDYSNLLESFLSILEKLPAYMATFDQTRTPWTVNIVAVSDTPASECRLSRNISTLTVETDRSELCTRIYVPGLQAPLEADTISKWGAVSRGLTGDEGLTADELTAYGTRYLEEHKNPALTVSIDALDLHKATGEQMDAFRLGYVCRVCLPDYGQTINQRIVTLSWPDLIADAENVRLTLASRAETAADTLAGLIVDTTVQRRLIYKNGQELDRLVVRTIANEEQITIITPRLDILSLDIEALADKIALQANDILTLSAGVEENRAAIVLTDGRIEANAAAIALKADATSVDALGTRVSSAEISIDGLNSEILLKADKIDLQGYTTLTDFEALKGEVENLFTSDLIVYGGLSANSVTAGDGDFDNIGFGTIAGQSPDAWVTGIVDEAGYATQAWVKNSGYITNGALAGYATQIWVNAKGYVTQDWVSKQGYLVSSDYFDLQAWVNDKNYMPKSGLTTATTKVCTGTQYTTATTPPFFNANGTQVSGGITYVKNVTYNTTDLTYLVYA